MFLFHQSNSPRLKKNQVCHHSYAFKFIKAALETASDNTPKRKEKKEQQKKVPLHRHESRHMLRAAELSLRCANSCAPHPRAGCVVVNKQGNIIGEGYFQGQGTRQAEVMAIEMAMKAAAAIPIAKPPLSIVSKKPYSSSKENHFDGNLDLKLSSRARIGAGNTYRSESGFASHSNNVMGKSSHEEFVTKTHQSRKYYSVLGDSVKIYLTLEPLSSRGIDEGLQCIIRVKPSIVFVGIEHPIKTHRGIAIEAMRRNGIEVVLLDEDSPEIDEVIAYKACVEANEALIHSSFFGYPFSILKYAMTLDGRIATKSGHSAWVSGLESRSIVHEVRACSNAIIVGGSTVRKDDPQLTIRLLNHQKEQQTSNIPVRVVLSRSMDLPREAKLWDVASAPTIVMTEKNGNNPELKATLRRRGVEIVEFQELTPAHVMDYCHMRGFIQCLWECGGELAAPAIRDGVIHKVMAFIAPKIVGGSEEHNMAPVGNLHIDMMTMAYRLDRIKYKQVGDDMLTTGYINHAGADKILNNIKKGVHQFRHPSWALNIRSMQMMDNVTVKGDDADNTFDIVFFYKPWDEFGSFSNFSNHDIVMQEEHVLDKMESQNKDDDSYSHYELQAADEIESAKSNNAVSKNNEDDEAKCKNKHFKMRRWPTVEHYYQASKFAIDRHPHARHIYETIALAPTPEVAARHGRNYERACPHLLRSNWSRIKKDIMFSALKAKFSAHKGARQMLLSTGNKKLIESSPNDYAWGCGYNGSGNNQLGILLMELRGQLLAAEESRKL